MPTLNSTVGVPETYQMILQVQEPPPS